MEASAAWRMAVALEDEAWKDEEDGILRKLERMGGAVKE
jgi:hypothetical protein